MRKRTCMLIGLAIIALIVAAILFYPQIASLFTPPPPCERDTLTLGEVTYPIQAITKTPVALPDTLPAALMLSAQDDAPVIWLYDSRPLDLLQPGMTFVITRSSCDTATYRLQDPQSLSEAEAALILIVDGVRLPASLQEAEIMTFPTPDPSDMLLEVSLLKTQVNEDTITISIAIANYGQRVIRVMGQDITLNGAAPQSSLPALPQEVAPGASINLTITFARPPALPTVLRIFDALYDVTE